MKNSLFIKPVGDLKIPNPGNRMRFLSENGESVTNNKYWQKRLSDKEVEEVNPPSEENNDDT